MRIKEFSKKQGEIIKFIREPENVLICDGAVRSGKTVVMAMSFLIWAMEHFSGCNFGICGKTITNAERNILKPLQQIEGIPYVLSYKLSNRCLTVRCGGRENYFYLFGGKDESSYMLIQGITLAGVMFDEVALMPQSFVDQAVARTLSYKNAKLWFNCNPESSNHWFYKGWIENNPKGAKHIHFLMSDNPILGSDEIERANKMFSGVFYDRYILGKWVAADGLIYDMFHPEVHIKDISSMQFDRYCISVDYGTQNPAVFLLFGRNAGKWYGVKEYYYSGRDKQKQKTDSEYADDMALFVGELAYDRIIVDPSAASFIAELKKRGFRVKKGKNDVVDGIRFTGSLFAQGELFIGEGMKQTIAELKSYVWDSKSAEKGEDKPVKENDHCMDAMRYFTYTELKKGGVYVW